MTSSQMKARNSQTDKLSAYIKPTGSCSHCKLNRETEMVVNKVHW